MNHHRHCKYTNKGAGYRLSDWPILHKQMNKIMANSSGVCESCGDGCESCQCAESLCNTNGTYQCMVCQGPQNMCMGEEDKGVTAACPATHQYCVKEISG